MTTPETPPAPFWARIVATGLYSGYVPWASGTVGTLAGLAIYLIPGMSQPFVLLAAILAGIAVGVPASARVAASEGHVLTKTAEIAKARFQKGKESGPDPSIIVIDEIVGMWIALLFIPSSLLAVGFAFVAFRVFDIIKPFPAVNLESLPNGWGIMLDDVVAGIYANIATWLFVFILSLIQPVS